MTANWRRWAGLESTLAPTSSSTVRPSALGTTAASAGRSTPGMVPITILAAIIAAPVLPAVTIAWARPSRTSSAQTRTDERRLWRIGVMAGSSMPTVSSACTTSMPVTSRKRDSSSSTTRRSPDQQHAVPVLHGGPPRPLHGGAGRVVSTHGIDGDEHTGTPGRPGFSGAGGAWMLAEAGRRAGRRRHRGWPQKLSLGCITSRPRYWPQ